LPTYEYRCDSCDRKFDVVQSFHDDPLTACPTCGSPVRKVFGNVGIVFKGSGFYKTDSRNGGPAKKKDTESAPVPASGSEGAPSDAGGSPSDSGGKEAAKPDTSPAKSPTSPPSKADSKPGGGSTEKAGKATSS
jgi:putative FmdB family regulatory protein